MAILHPDQPTNILIYFLSNTNTNKIISTLNTEDELIKGLINNSYDIIFINHDIKIDGCITKKTISRTSLYFRTTYTFYLWNESWSFMV